MSLSVVIPTFNGGSLLIESVESALAQTYAALDVTVVDDGSTDPDSLRIQDEISERERVRLVRQANSGVAGAINAGIRASRGKYILILADDDLIEPTYATKAIAVLENTADVGVVYCRARKFGRVDGAWELPKFSPDQMAIMNCVFASAFYRRDDWDRLGGYRETLDRGMEDYDFWIRMIGLGRGFVQLPEVLFHYRTGNSGLTAEYFADLEVRERLLWDIRTFNEPFFADHVLAILRELDATKAELARWRADYSKIDRTLGDVIRSGLSLSRSLRTPGSRRRLVGSRDNDATNRGRQWLPVQRLQKRARPPQG